MRPGPHPETRTRLVVGTMTGTSIDGLDAALLRIQGTGLGMRCELEAHAAFDFSDDLRRRLRAAAEQTPLTAGDFARLAFDFGVFHAERLSEFLASRDADLVGLHGQTVFHAPPASWQLLQPAPVAQRLGVPVVCDLRQSDLAAGGQGAPITPLADWVLFRGDNDRVILNLGGFCNATILLGGGDPESVRGFDVCACNQILDAVARSALGAPFDAGGQAAAGGAIDADAAARLTSLLLTQRAAGRSLGTGDEASGWISTAARWLRPADLAATAAFGVGSAIATVVRSAGLTSSPTTYLAGGGARHQPLAQAIALNTGCPALPLASIGMPVEVRESACMAVLGALAADGVDITLSATTGRGEKQSGDGAWLAPRRRWCLSCDEGESASACHP